MRSAGRLNTLIHAAKHPARLLTEARILLKADASKAGEGWSDSQIAAALDTSVDKERAVVGRSSVINPARPTVAHRAGLSSQEEDVIAAEFGR
jgi:hypothetical protein